jgi:hypothetical protein
LHFHESLPETEALIKIINRTKPDFMYSLHNTGFGGAYWYISHDFPELYDALKNTATKQGVSLSLGEPEAPYVKEFSPAIFQTLSTAQYYDYTEQYTGKKPAIHLGTSSAEYALTKSDCVTLVTELPYFFDLVYMIRMKAICLVKKPFLKILKYVKHIMRQSKVF